MTAHLSIKTACKRKTLSPEKIQRIGVSECLHFMKKVDDSKACLTEDLILNSKVFKRKEECFVLCDSAHVNFVFTLQ